MPPSPWATPEQLVFLVAEDAQWATTKAGQGTLKSFYARTTNAFLEKWPVTPDAKFVDEANGNMDRAKQLAEDNLLKQITTWYSNRHRQTKPTPRVSQPLLDLSGKYSRKKPPLQKWQAFSILYYRPQGSPLRAEVKLLFNRRNDPTAVAFLTDFLPSDADISTTDYLTFLSAFARERCTRLSVDEEEKVQAYINEQQSLDAEHRDHPWFLDDDYEDEPLLAENKYIQQRIDEIPRVAQRALDEIEKATGFKGFMFLGGLTPTDNGAITTHIYTSGVATTTGLSFIESWGASSDLNKAFVDWLQMAYSDEEKRRREGFQAITPTPTTDESTTFNEPAPRGPTPSETPALGSPGHGQTPAIPATETPTTPATETPVTPATETPVTPATETPVTPATETPVTPAMETPVTPATETPVTPTTETLATPATEVVSSPATQESLPSPTRHTPSPNTPPLTRPSVTTSMLPPTIPDSGAQTDLFKHDPSYPDFITTAVIEYVNSVDGGFRWAEMVKDYLKLESKYPSRRVGRLAMQTRPKEVVNWGRQRNSVPSITDVEQFRDQWITWWGSCQPKWRSVKPWPFPRDNAEGKDWARLNVTGPHGLFAVVMSASWWAASVDSNPHLAALDAAIADLHWVIGNLIYFSSQLKAIGPELKATPASHFPGHGERDTGKRKIKPSSKACYP